MLDFDVKTDYLRMPAGKIAAFFTVQIENKELAFEKTNQVQKSKVAFLGRIISVDEKMKGMFEDEVAFSVNETELNSATATNKQSYIKGVVLPPGSYKVTVFVRDSLSGMMGLEIFKIQVPNL